MSSKLLQGFLLGPWKVEPLRGVVSGTNGETHHLEPKVMDVFVCLAERANELVTRNQLLDVAWSGNTAFDEQLTRAIGELRRALRDDRGDPEYIETVPKRGYRLICPVTLLAADSDMPEIAIHSSSEWRYRRRNLAIFAGIASIVVAIILIANPQIRDQLLQTNEGPRERSVAVLPFVDLSEDGSQQYLGDGVSEELIHVLSNLPDLRVIARTSSFAFRDSNEDIPQIGNKLNVATILEGSVRKDGDRIRITAQLVNSRDGYHLWSKSFDRHSSNLFKIQNEIAVAVAKTFDYRQLDAYVTNQRVAQPDELQTYELYLLGMYHLHKEIPSAYAPAIEYFERAIEKDPSFARAYAGLSESYSDWYWSEPYHPDLVRKAESAAEYALLLDDHSGDAYRAVGYTKLYKRDFSGAEAAFTKAIELNPNDVRSYAWLADAYRNQGEVNASAVMLQTALERNPMSGHLNTRMAIHYYSKTPGDWDTAFKYFKRAMQRDPDYPYSYSYVGEYYMSTGQIDRAIPYVRKAVDMTNGPGKVSPAAELLTMMYVSIGDYESAATVIRRMKEWKPDHFGAINVEIHLQLARGDFSAVRDVVHGLLPKYIDMDLLTSLMAFYEMVTGDTHHAEDIYARLAAAQEPDTYGEVNLYRGNELGWGMMGAVNLAYLYKRNGQNRAAQELLRKAREFIESENDLQWYIDDSPLNVGAFLYVLAQISAIEGHNDAAIENVREAIDAGWTTVWFGRIDPIMVDLREDARYMRVLEELEDKLSEMRKHPKKMASNEP